MSETRTAKKDVILWALWDKQLSLAQAKAQLKDLKYEDWEIDLFLDGDAGLDPEDYE